MPESRYGLAHFASIDPDTIALTESHGRRLSRLALSQQANQTARALRRHGLKRGEVIAILAPNCLEFVSTYLAAIDIGLYVVPINWHLMPTEVQYVLENSGACALFVHERLGALAQRLLDSSNPARITLRVAFGAIDGFESYEQFIAAESTDRPEDPVVGRMLMYTSATTGRPKAIQLPIRDAASALSRTIDFHLSCGVALQGGNVHLCVSMLYHAAPLEFVWIALQMGHHVVLVERWEAEQLLKLIEEHRVTTTFMVPAMFIRLLKLPASIRARYDTGSLKLVTHSAAPCPPEVKRQLIEWWGPIIWESYGAAEGVGTAVNSADWLRRPGTVGRAMQGTTLGIFDDEGCELPAGRIGTIYLSRFTGDRFEYKDDPEKTQKAYRGDLFTVGDVGYLDEEGYLYICDRKIDMIISGGMNVYSAEIEQVLVEHASVLDCAVFGIPDELMGEAVHAVVQPAAHATPNAQLTAALMQFMRQRLSAVKLPRSIEYSTQLPRDPNGKLYKRLLRERHWQGLPRKI
jgi:long-chain acyl-CoA synthetase